QGEHLVLFLSDLPSGGTWDQACPGWPRSVPRSRGLAADIDALMEAKRTNNVKWAWEMPLRAIQHHHGRLKSVTILCSHDSLSQLPWFGNIVKEYVSGGEVQVNAFLWPGDLVDCPTKAPDKGGWDFEAFDALSQGLDRLIRELETRGAREREIVIDITSGQKP